MRDVDGIRMDIGAGSLTVAAAVAFFRIKRNGIITFPHSYTPLNKFNIGEAPPVVTDVPLILPGRVKTITLIIFKFEIRSTKHETNSNDRNSNDPKLGFI